MTIKNTGKDADGEATDEFEVVGDNENINFPGDDSDERAIDANELPEQPRYISHQIPIDEPIDSRLTDFFSTLPHNNGTRFIVARLPDRSMSGKFRLPCDEEEECESVYWKGESEPSEIYAKIRNMNGGGVYRIRTHGNTGFVKGGTWTITIADPAKKSDKEKIVDEKAAKAKADEQPRVVESLQNSNSHPISEQPIAKNGIGEVVAMAKDLKEAATLFYPPAPPAAPAPVMSNPAADIKPQTKAEIALEFYSIAVDEKAKSKIIDSIFGTVSDENLSGEEKGFIAQTFDYVVNNPQNTLTAIQTIFGGFTSILAPVIGGMKANQPPAVPNLPIKLNAIRAPRNDAEGAPQPEKQPQAQETAQNAAIQPPPVVVVPSIKLED